MGARCPPSVQFRATACEGIVCLSLKLNKGPEGRGKEKRPRNPYQRLETIRGVVGIRGLVEVTREVQ